MRRGKLKKLIKKELKNNPNIDTIISYVDEYEANNKKIINNYQRDREVTIKRIGGAIKSTINAHGPIKKENINSLSKRLHGALIVSENKPKEKKTNKVTIRGILLGFFIGMVIFYSLINLM